MGVFKNLFTEGSRSTINKGDAKKAFKKGAETVLHEFGPHAGRRLQKGDGSIMRTFNLINNKLKKL